MGKKKGTQAQVVETQETAETVEPTIVDCTETEVFQQEPEIAPAEEATTQETAPAEKPAERKSRANKRPYLEHLKSLLEQGTHTRKELVENIMAAYPTVNKGGIQTVISDLKNEKYNIFKERRVVVTGGDRLIFADCVEAPSQTETAPPVEMVMAEATQAEQAEQPAE